MDKENYNEHFLLNTETAKTYAVEYLKYFNIDSKHSYIWDYIFNL